MCIHMGLMNCFRIRCQGPIKQVAICVVSSLSCVHGQQGYNANFALDINIKRSFSWGFRLISKKNDRFNFSVFDIYVGKNVQV